MAPVSSKPGLTSTLCAMGGFAMMGSYGTSFLTASPSSLAEHRATGHQTVVGRGQQLAVMDQESSALAVGWRSGMMVAAAAALGNAARGKCARKVKNMMPSAETPKIQIAEAFTDSAGATKPMGFWDPLDLSGNMDELEFRRRRVTEIKNGRVAMIACMGYIAPEFFRWPGYIAPSMQLKFTDIPNGLGALYKVPAEAWAQIGVFIGFLELFPMRQEAERAPGDFATCGRLGIPWFFIPLKNTDPNALQSKSDPIRSARSLDAELNNGRLAMVAITGMIFQNVAAGSTGAALYGLGL